MATPTTATGLPPKEALLKELDRTIYECSGADGISPNLVCAYKELFKKYDDSICEASYNYYEEECYKNSPFLPEDLKYFCYDSRENHVKACLTAMGESLKDNKYCDTIEKYVKTDLNRSIEECRDNIEREKLHSASIEAATLEECLAIGEEGSVITFNESNYTDKPLTTSCIIRLVGESPTAKICERIRSESPTASDFCYRRHAQVTLNSTECLMISDALAVDECLTEIAKGLKDETICNQARVWDNSSTDSCFYAVAVAKRDLALCPQRTRDLCGAVIKRDYSLCEKEGIYCIRTVAVQNKDVEGCQRLINPEDTYRSWSATGCVTEIATQLDDETLCEFAGVGRIQCEYSVRNFREFPV